MSASIPLKARVNLGVVPTHLKFVGGLVPDEAGKLPRAGDGQLLVIANLKQLCEASPVKISCVQVPTFYGVDAGDVKEMCDEFRALGLEPFFIMMVGGADPMDPADEDAVVKLLVAGLELAKQNEIRYVASTSVEEWMRAGAQRKDGAAFDAAVAQNVKVHTRAYREAQLEGSSVQSWDIEFLRGGEFMTFTDIGRSWTFVKAANESLGKPFFKVMVDAAHCGDSDLTIPEHQAIIDAIASGGALGIFHASAKTTRGCLSTDDGWIASLLKMCAATGKLQTVFVEVFHHQDDALEPLRKMDPGHGLDTRDGRSYDQVVVDGLTDVARRLNNLVVRGVLAQ